MAESDIRLRPIGVIRTPHKEAAGTPIQPRFAEGAEGSVQVFPEYAEGLADLAGFDRVWLLYRFDRVRDVRLKVTPYLDTEPRGLFATRAPCRPNPIGLSCVRLLLVEGALLRIADVDMLDGTPLLDIKPYCPRFDCYEARRCGWLDDVDAGGGVADGRFHDKAGPTGD